MIETEPLGESPVVYSWEWELAATPEQLWPLISDTNRINRLASMAPVRFEETPDPEGGSSRVGHATQLGLSVRWDEQPFEWAYPAGLSVRRDFHNGVLKCYRSSVLLEPVAAGTRLVHTVELIPRIGLMAAFIRREGVKLQRNWDHAYRVIEAYLRGEGPFPFDAPTGTAPDVEQRLFDHVLGQHAHELAHIRPFVLADRWRIERAELLAAALQLVRRALIRPQWSLLCPHCRGAKGTADTLGGLKGKVHCASCNISFERLSDDKVELTFRPDPRYRRIEEATYCVGGPGATPHICFQSRIQPGAARDVGLTVEPGGYRLRGPRLRKTLDLQYYGPPTEPPPEGEALPEPPTVAIGKEGFSVEGLLPLEGAKLRVRLLNETSEPLDVLIETRSWRDDVLTLAWLRERPELLAALEAS